MHAILAIAIFSAPLAFGAVESLKASSSLKAGECAMRNQGFVVRPANKNCLSDAVKKETVAQAQVGPEDSLDKCKEYCTSLGGNRYCQYFGSASETGSSLGDCFACPEGTFVAGNGKPDLRNGDYWFGPCKAAEKKAAAAESERPAAQKTKQAQ